MSNHAQIAAVVDKHLAKLVEEGINHMVGQVEPEMSDPGNDPKDEWQKWLPIKSTVTGPDIAELETHLGHRLPADYVAFLAHKHFYDLYINEASFCRHPVRTWKKHITDMVFHGYPTEYLIERGWLPFADWSDWGLLCFDTTTGSSDYPVGLWDHERPDELEPKHESFFELLTWLDKEADING
jgi:hypothetical protein